MTALALDELVAYRQQLQTFCKLHVPSLKVFSFGPVFLLDTEEQRKDEGRIHHLTSTATCFESLSNCPTAFQSLSAEEFESLGERFASGAITLPTDKDPISEKDKERIKFPGDNDRWRSDESARVYCRCRALPFITKTLKEWHPKLEEHLGTIFHQFKVDEGRLAIGEADEHMAQADWYPPNAYHTYWTLELLDRLQARFPIEYSKLSQPDSLNLKLRGTQMVEWAKQRIGHQVALHTANSSVLDSDQLAWSLAIALRYPEEYQSSLSQQDFIRQAFKCLFSTQTAVGTWPHYAPLFHYKKTGNAYCFVFETFAVILKEALRKDATFVREVLKEYLDKLMLLWSYARSTQTTSPLTLENGQTTPVVSWSSGHRTNKVRSESWATASVFDYAQALRRLIGIWTREEALSTLRVSAPFSSPAEAQGTLLERANVWRRDNLNFADQLWSMFINPARLGPADELDPDVHAIRKSLPRSAILFGPPGTSKTTIAKTIAGAIGWKYVELHASDFVAEGLPNVQHTADVLFRRLMQLDRAVVLFDEVDELVRERDAGSDAFGRFLTTSMLPKLAELWKARKIIYFVATNHIEYFDRAIIRSERFDAVLFVSPPSFETKVNRVRRILNDVYGRTNTIFTVTREDIEAALPDAVCDEIAKQTETQPTDSDGLHESNLLAKFVLLRFDELSELAFRLHQELGRDGVVTKEILEMALRNIDDKRWRTIHEYCEYLKGPSFERRDFSMNSVWSIKDPPERLAASEVIEKREKAAWLIGPGIIPTDIPVPGYVVEAEGPGQVILKESVTPSGETSSKPELPKVSELSSTGTPKPEPNS